MLLLFAGDHAGFEMKGKLMEFVRSLGHEVEDMGPFSYDAGDDYPDFVIPLAIRIAKAQMNADTKTQIYADADTQINADRENRRTSASYHRESAVRGIVVAGSGQGEIIAMNRIRGARAALFYGPRPALPGTGNQSDMSNQSNWSYEIVRVSRDHNDSNILCIGARFCTLDEAKQGITIWLQTPFSDDERHIRRLRKIDVSYRSD